MPDCDHPKCHEQLMTDINNRVQWEQHDKLRLEVAGKMPKTWLRWWWVGFAAVGIPLFTAAIGVWSGQQSDILRYADRNIVTENKIRLTKLEEFRGTISREISQVRHDIDNIQMNVNEILKLLRESKK